MSKSEKIESYFENEKTFKKELLRLREIVSATALVEDFKWNSPVYTINGKNVLGLGSHKHHYGVWFFNGALLDDKTGALHNAQEGKTKALRQLRYDDDNPINENVLRDLLAQAIENQKQGREIKSAKPVKKVTDLPTELKTAMAEDDSLNTAFKALTPGRQKEYAEHIGSAKQEKTRISRLEKVIPLILSGKGLHDKYKNC